MRLHAGKKERRRTEKVTLVNIATTVISTSCDYFLMKIRLKLYRLKLFDDDIEYCFHLCGRQGWSLAWTSPSVRRTPVLPSSRAIYIPVLLSGWFVGDPPDSHEQRYLRSIHTTTIVATVLVHRCDALAKNSIFAILIRFLFIIANIYTSICQCFGRMKPLSEQ